MEYDNDAAHDPETLQALYARTMFALRESRKHLLKQYGLDSEDALLQRIRSGELAEHPAYEHYLSARITTQVRDAVRAQAAAELAGAVFDAGADDAPACVHLMLQDLVGEHYGERLSEPPRLAQDALLLSFDTGLMLEARYFSRDEYSIAWSWGDAELRVDTAPVHALCASFPNHLHDAGGAVRPDSVTRTGNDCWLNFSRLLDRLLDDPLLERQASGAPLL